MKRKLKLLSHSKVKVLIYCLQRWKMLSMESVKIVERETKKDKLVNKEISWQFRVEFENAKIWGKNYKIFPELVKLWIYKRIDKI